MQGEGVGGEDGLRAGRDNDDGSETGFGARYVPSPSSFRIHHRFSTLFS